MGSNWKGGIPVGKFDKLFECETNLATVIGRIQLLGSDDLPDVLAIQGGYKDIPLSFLMGEELKTSPAVD